MVLGDADGCAKCGHGEIWHPTCCIKQHRFIPPLIIGRKVLTIGDKFYYNFPGEEDFPNDPKGWILCTFRGTDHGALIVKPRGFERFVISRTDPERFSLVDQWGEKVRQ